MSIKCNITSHNKLNLTTYILFVKKYIYLYFKNINKFFFYSLLLNHNFNFYININDKKDLIQAHPYTFSFFILKKRKKPIVLIRSPHIYKKSKEKFEFSYLDFVVHLQFLNEIKVHQLFIKFFLIIYLNFFFFWIPDTTSYKFFMFIKNRFLFL